jgi:hypothetical protein
VFLFRWYHFAHVSSMMHHVALQSDDTFPILLQRGRWAQVDRTPDFRSDIPRTNLKFFQCAPSVPLRREACLALMIAQGSESSAFPLTQTTIHSSKIISLSSVSLPHSPASQLFFPPSFSPQPFSSHSPSPASQSSAR